MISERTWKGGVREIHTASPSVDSTTKTGSVQCCDRGMTAVGEY
jgi:hypothetical protein